MGNRLQEALWREALHMVAAGEATVEEIDASIAYGPGLRWALMGPCLTFHLAGGVAAWRTCWTTSAPPWRSRGPGCRRRRSRPNCGTG